MRRTFLFEVLVEADVEGEFDPQYVRDALVFGFERMRDEGYLTALEDESTSFGAMQVIFRGDA